MHFVKTVKKQILINSLIHLFLNFHDSFNFHYYLYLENMEILNLFNIFLYFRINGTKSLTFSKFFFPGDIFLHCNYLTMENF